MNQLFICNTGYQIMIALWLKHCQTQSIKTDIIVSDHMNGGEEIAQRLEATGLYENVYYAQTLKEARYLVERNKWESIAVNLNPRQALRQYVPLTEDYSDVYLANFDGFSQLLFTALSRNNPALRLHVFEDGLSTYCELEKYYRYFEHHYYQPSDDKNVLKRFLHRKIYKLRPIYGNITDFNVFNPELMKWNPDCAVIRMKKIDVSDDSFSRLVRQVFAMDKSIDRYDRKYIFFEESFFADGEAINDVEIVDQLAQRVGKENIMVKIHPRNPVNRFAERGYKTNVDTSIPWEIILMALGDVSDKVFLTVASSAILNPIMIFGSKIKAYSLYPCLKVVPERLQGSTWDFLKELFLTYSDMIHICEDLDTIE